MAVTLTAALSEGEGTILWFERRSDGQFTQKAKGPSYKANLRVKKGDGDFIYYVCVQRADGSVGGKVPVRIPVVQGE